MKHVKSGESFSFPAAEWNEMADAVNHVRAHAMDEKERFRHGVMPPGIVLVRNATGSHLSDRAVLVVGELETDPGEDGEVDVLHDVNYFVGMLASDAKTQSKPFLVTLEDIDADEVGLAIAVGVTPVKVNILDKDHEFVRPAIGSATAESCKEGGGRILWKGAEADDDGLRPCLILVGGGGGAADGYSGMFRLDFTENDGEIKVHNSDMLDGGIAGIAAVNNQPFALPNQVFTPPLGASYVYVKFTPPVRESPEAEFVEATASLTLEAGLRWSDDKAQWYLIGSVQKKDDGKIVISQDHRAGAVRMTWFGPCNFLGTERQEA